MRKTYIAASLLALASLGYVLLRPAPKARVQVPVIADQPVSPAIDMDHAVLASPPPTANAASALPASSLPAQGADSTSASMIDVIVLHSTGEPASSADVSVSSSSSASAMLGVTNHTGHVFIHPAMGDPSISQTEGNAWTLVRVTLGAEAALTLVHEAAPKSVEMRLEPGIVVRVRILDSQGASVHATARLHSSTFGPLLIPPTNVESDPLEFPPLPQSAMRQGGVYVDAHAPRFADASASVPSDYAGLAPIELRLAPVVRVRGRLVAGEGAPATGTVEIVGARGRATHSARWESRAEGTRMERRMEGGGKLVETDAAGRFDVEGLPTGGGDIVVFADGFAPLRLPDLKGDNGDLDLGDVVLQAGGVVRGIVEDGDGQPVRGARVFLEGGDANSLIATAGTDEQGRFAMEHIGTGKHIAKASWSEGREDWQTRNGEASDVRAEGPVVHIVLVGGITVRFFGATTHKPMAVPWARLGIVELGGSGNSSSQSETASGSLDHVRAEPGPGVYDVSVEVRDYEMFEFKAVRLAGVREVVLDAYFREKAR